MYTSNTYKSYGLYIDKEAFKLICIDPKIAFNSIGKENPKLMILTSGTLGEKNKMAEIYGLKF